MSAEALVQGPQDYFRLLNTTLDRKFRIERLVAEGGFGVLYFGTHLSLQKPIAIKVLKVPAEFNEAARATFIDKFALEARTIARLAHPNIVQVLDFGVSPMPTGELGPWMVLEWLTGNTLEQLIASRRNNPYAPLEAMALIRPVIEALAYAHDEGIAHRDIKPANIMILESRRGPVFKLLDFGIAKVMDDKEDAGSGNTRTRTVMSAFSPAYAAPEQLSGTRTGPWTDVHAIALIITEMMTGMPPYDGDEPTSLFAEVLSPRRPTPAKRMVDCGPWEAVLNRATAVKPDERIKTAGELLAALDAAMPVPQRTATGQFTAVGAVPAPVGQPAPTGPATAPTGKSGKGGLFLVVLLLAGLGTGIWYLRTRSLSPKPVGMPLQVVVPVVDAGSVGVADRLAAADVLVAPVIAEIVPDAAVAVVATTTPDAAIVAASATPDAASGIDPVASATHTADASVVDDSAVAATAIVDAGQPVVATSGSNTAGGTRPGGRTDGPGRTGPGGRHGPSGGRDPHGGHPGHPPGEIPIE